MPPRVRMIPRHDYPHANAVSEDPRLTAFRQTQIISSGIENLKQDKAEHTTRAAEPLQQLSQFKFEKLIPELRNQIYEYFFHDNTYQVACRDAWRRGVRPPHPPLCMTSTRIRNEFFLLSESRSMWILEISATTLPDLLKWVRGTGGRPLHPQKVRFIWDGYIFEIKVLLHITIDLSPNCIDDRVELVDTWEPLPSEFKNDELDKYMDKINIDCACIAEGLYSERKAGRLTSRYILDAADKIFTQGWKGVQIV